MRFLVVKKFFIALMLIGFLFYIYNLLWWIWTVNDWLPIVVDRMGADITVIAADIILVVGVFFIEMFIIYGNYRRLIKAFIWCLIGKLA